MKPVLHAQRVLGIALVAIGGYLVLMGMKAPYHPIPFVRWLPQAATWYTIGGIALTLLGLLMTLALLGRTTNGRPLWGGRVLKPALISRETLFHRKGAS
jgi:hypothetical protein